MQVILPDEQIHQLQLLISQLIENEIKNKKKKHNNLINLYFIFLPPKIYIRNKTK